MCARRDYAYSLSLLFLSTLCSLSLCLSVSLSLLFPILFPYAREKEQRVEREREKERHNGHRLPTLSNRLGAQTDRQTEEGRVDNPRENVQETSLPSAQDISKRISRNSLYILDYSLRSLYPLLYLYFSFTRMANFKTKAKILVYNTMFTLPGGERKMSPSSVWKNVPCVFRFLCGVSIRADVG